MNHETSLKISHYETALKSLEKNLEIKRLLLEDESQVLKAAKESVEKLKSEKESMEQKFKLRMINLESEVNCCLIKIESLLNSNKSLTNDKHTILKELESQRKKEMEPSGNVGF